MPSSQSSATVTEWTAEHAAHLERLIATMKAHIDGSPSQRKHRTELTTAEWEVEYVALAALVKLRRPVQPR